MYNLLPISRFSKTLTCKMLCIASISCLSFSSWAFTFNDVVAKAEKLSKKSYVQPSKNIPSELSSLQFLLNMIKLIGMIVRVVLNLSFIMKVCISTRRLKLTKL